MKKLISAFFAIVMSIGAFGVSAPVSAAPMAVEKPVTTSGPAAANSNVQTVQYYYRDRYDRRWDRRWDRRYDRRWDRRYDRRWDRRWDRRYDRRWDRRWDRRPYWHHRYDRRWRRI